MMGLKKEAIPLGRLKIVYDVQSYNNKLKEESMRAHSRYSFAGLFFSELPPRRYGDPLF
jgi:hypothetical protein